MREDREPPSRLVARRMIGANPVNTIVIAVAFGIVAAEDADAERIAHIVSFHHGHRHLRKRQSPERRAADPVVADSSVREVRDDPFTAPDHGAVLDEARGEIEAERDVDALGVVAGGRMDEAIPNRDGRPAHMNPVELRA